jgi:predicted AlkP superfamily phosphohydrolase/phosphomutase
MRVFALPAYYDVQLRLNLAGRESNGLVERLDYDRVRHEVVAMIRECRDPVRGHSVVEKVVLPDKPPEEIGPTEADIYLSFAGNTTGLLHPVLGTIGPVPYRRTGGHTGDWGFLYIGGLPIQPGDRGDAAAFDVVPTIIDLLGGRRRADLSGASLMRRL